MILIAPDLCIPVGELHFSYARSSGPGGQNVNKVNSKAVLHWNVRSCASLSIDVRARIMSRLSTRMNQEGDLVIASDRHRDRIRNREDCIEKLVELVAWAVSKPKARKKSKPSRSSQQRVKEGKRRVSEKKSLRKRPI